MNKLTHPMYAVMFALLTFPAFAAEKFGVAVSGTNSGGCPIPDVSLLYENQIDAHDLEVYGRVRMGGNRVCADTIGADISIERDFGLVSLDLGYDRRGVAVHDDGTEKSYYGSVQAETAAVALNLFDFEIGYDLLNEAPRVERSFKFKNIELNADLTRYPGTGLVLTSRAAWEYEFSGGWALELSGSFTADPNNMPDGVTWSHTGPPPAAPESVWSYALGFTKEL